MIMKRIIHVVLLVVLTGMFFVGCSIFPKRSSSVELEFADDSNGVQSYIMVVEAKNNVFVPRLELDRNNETFSIMHDVLSSTIIGGTYKIQDNMFVAKTDDNKSTYQFEIVDSRTLKFVQSNSSEIALTDEDVGIPISDGSIFKLQK